MERAMLDLDCVWIDRLGEDLVGHRGSLGPRGRGGEVGFGPTVERPGAGQCGGVGGLLALGLRRGDHPHVDRQRDEAAQADEADHDDQEHRAAALCFECSMGVHF